MTERRWRMSEREGNLVVKLFPPGTPRETAEDEARVTGLVRQYGLDAPFAHGVVEQDGALGVEFDRAIGPTYTQWVLQHPNQLNRLAEFFAHQHRELHLHKVGEVPSLKAVLQERIAALPGGEELRQRLGRMPDGDWLLHWNFHPDHVTVSVDGPVVYHWGEAMRGDYLADVARTSLLLDDWDPDPGEREAVERIKERFHRAYLFEYIKACGRTDEELEEWKELLGRLRREGQSPSNIPQA